MKRTGKKLEWSHLYWSWKYACEALDSDLMNGVEFMQIERPGLPENLVELDWWPKNQIGERRDPRSTPGYIITWETKAGTLRTARLLWDAKDDLEKQHAVFILASLWDKEKDLPERWRGDIYRLVKDVQDVILEKHPVPRWHHASRDALPLGVVRDYHAGRTIVPEDESGLMYVAALEAVLSYANWQLIEYVKELPQRLELVH